MVKKSEVLLRASRLGLCVETWTPGDGRRRYGFSHSGRALRVAVGPAEAMMFVDGWAACMDVQTLQATRDIWTPVLAAERG